MPEIINCDKVLSRHLRKQLRNMMGRVKRRVKKNVSGGILQKRSGAAAKAIFTSVRKFRGGVKASIGAKLGTGAFYLKFFEKTGAVSHQIPKQRNVTDEGGFTIRRRKGKSDQFRVKKALKINGRFVRRPVKHPGVRKRPFIEPEVEKRKLDQDLKLIEKAMEDTALECIPRTIRIKV